MSHTISQVYTYRNKRYVICTYKWYTGMHQTRHGNYCSNACGLHYRTSKHGNHDCGTGHALAKNSVRGNRSPISGVVKVCEAVSGQALFLSGGVLRVNHPNNLSSSQNLRESKKKVTCQKKERLVCKQLHFTVIHHVAICDTVLILLLPFVVTSATS